MIRSHTAPGAIDESPVPAARVGVSPLTRRSREIGYRALLLLAFMLPFDMEQRPLLWTNSLSVTDLTVLLLGVAALATLSSAGLAIHAHRGSPGVAGNYSRRRVPLALCIAFLLSSAVSTILARSSTQGLTWLLGILAGSLLWLAMPLWLADDAEVKVNHLRIAIVAGAIVTSIIGIIEIVVGPGFDQHLLFFKFGPDTLGPFLRLSATFSSANVAAMYLELALTFAVTGLIGALGRPARQWIVCAVWLAAINILLLALLLTYSRGAFLGLLAAGLAMALGGRRALTMRTAARRRGATIVAANLALVLGFLAFSRSPIELLRFSTLNDGAWYQARYISHVPTTMIAGRMRTIPVTVENRGPLTWNASSPHAYGLGYHWLRPSWAVVRFTSNITWLSSDLRPGGRRTIQASVVAPTVPGRYLLVWDMIWKGTTWFSPKTGAYRAIPLRVVEPLAASGTSPPLRRAAPPDISYLPTAPPLDRGHIWAVAIRMIENRPLFGMGPQGVRMNYAAFVPPGLPGKPPPHAHNLVLEMLADWGVLGGGVFAALLTVLWWPLLQRVRRGHVESVWELSVVGAAGALLGHGLVDYFLNKQAILIVFWLLCGLAATMTRRPYASVHR